jgi:glutamate/tyrosine decarboxylase-like PLP-dependent enzyme
VLTDGIEQADSWATDGHKWLQLPYDCGFAIVRDSTSHRRAMGISASYLPSSTYEPGQFTPELSRRARGFAVWAMLRLETIEARFDRGRGQYFAGADISRSPCGQSSERRP